LFGGYGLALAAWALVVFGAYGSYPFFSTQHTVSSADRSLLIKSPYLKHAKSIQLKKKQQIFHLYALALKKMLLQKTILLVIAG